MSGSLGVIGSRGRLARICAVAAAGVVLFALPGQGRAETTLVFGAYSSDKPSAMVKQVRPTLNAISKATAKYHGSPIRFRMQIVKGYDNGVQHLIRRDFDIMRLGPASYVHAKKAAPNIVILAMESNNGRNTFSGVIAVPLDSPIKTLDELRGKKFAFGSEHSTLGRYFAQLTLARAGVLAKDLGSFKYLGRHDTVGQAVGAKLFDAGALEGSTFAKLVKNGVPIRALLTFDNATRPWIARAGLDPKLVEVIRKAMMDVKDKKALARLRFDGFLPGSDANYELTRQAIEQNPRFFVGYSQAASSTQGKR